MATRQTKQQEAAEFQARIAWDAAGARSSGGMPQPQSQPGGPAIASAPLGQLMNALGSAEAALQVTQDTLIEAADRQNKLDAITGDVEAVEEAELVRRYPALEA